MPKAASPAAPTTATAAQRLLVLSAFVAALTICSCSAAAPASPAPPVGSAVKPKLDVSSLKSRLLASSGETPEYTISPPPPFKGAAWVEEVLKVFEEEYAEWEDVQEDGGETADPMGPQHARMGIHHLNPAFDLTASGTTERAWSTSRIAAYARQEGFANVTSATAEQWIEDQNLTSQLGRHYIGDDDWENATPQGWNAEDDANAAAGPDDAQSLRIHGTDIWGGNMTLDTEMDANTDPWFNVNADTETRNGVFDGHAVDPSIEPHVKRQLDEFKAMCEEASKFHKLKKRQVFNSLNPEDDQQLNDHVSLPSSMVFESRKRTASLASNKWIDNVDMMPSQEWNPVQPKEMWTMKTQEVNTLNQFDLGSQGGFDGGADHNGRLSFATPFVPLIANAAGGRLAACPSSRRLAATTVIGTRMSASAGPSSSSCLSVTRRSVVRGALFVALSGVLGLRTEHSRAEGGGGVSTAGSDKYGYKFDYPDSWKVSKKPVQTHMDEILVKKGGGTEVGVAVDPVKIDSIVKFGTPKEVAARVIGVERKKDGVTGARLIASSAEERDGNSYYVIEYESKSSRGDKHFISCVTIAGKKLYAMTAQAKIAMFEESEADLRAAVASFSVSPPP